VMVLVGATDAAPLRPPRNHLQFSRTTSQLLWHVGSWDSAATEQVGLSSPQAFNLEWCRISKGDSPVPVCRFGGEIAAPTACVVPVSSVA
jgi:hypothetical protein